ncbi:hypothetical protein BX600DRAFT_461125 [Xylariales sp. PMI_506]|nr:hypothetical protein BX600DRAFT_461125 [Xylariales sp. PMI_506]
MHSALLTILGISGLALSQGLPCNVEKRINLRQVGTTSYDELPGLISVFSSEITDLGSWITSLEAVTATAIGEDYISASAELSYDQYLLSCIYAWFATIPTSSAPPGSSSIYPYSSSYAPYTTTQVTTLTTSYTTAATAAASTYIPSSTTITTTPETAVTTTVTSTSAASTAITTLSSTSSASSSVSSSTSTPSTTSSSTASSTTPNTNSGALARGNPSLLVSLAGSAALASLLGALFL